MTGTSCRSALCQEISPIHPSKLPPPSPHWLLFQQAVGLYGIFIVSVLVAHLIMGENPEAWPGDDIRGIGKIYVGAATTWLIWRASRRSLDRGGRT